MISDVIAMAEFRALFPDYNFRSTSKQYYEWKLLKNPFTQGSIIFERNKAGMVIGSITITPKRAFIGGRILAIAERGDAFTHPEYRRQGILTRNLNASAEAAISQGFKVIYAAPNSQSLPGSMKKGSRPCPFVNWKLLTKRPWSFQTVVKSIARPIAKRKLDPDDINMWQRRFSRKKAKQSYESFEILIADKFTEEIDGLWGSPRYIFFVVRDKTYLNWRYFENPDVYQVLVAKQNGRYLGYVVTKVSKDGIIGIICDFITVDDRLDVFFALIREAEKILGKAGVQIIQLRCVENSPYYQALINQGYYDHDSSSWQPVNIFSGTDCGKMLLETEGKWHYTFSDTDNV